MVDGTVSADSLHPGGSAEINSVTHAPSTIATSAQRARIPARRPRA